MVFGKTHSKLEEIMEKKKEIERPNDLAPRGIKYTVKGNYTFNEVFEHIFKESRKPIKK
jgi:hypothetical protein